METGKAHPGPEARFERPLFAAVITPHQSLGPRGFRFVMGLLALLMLVPSAVFIALGFWPVAGFFGLDLLAVYWAFRVSFRRSRSFEEVILTPIELLLRRVTQKGERREWRFNPLWTKLDRQHDEEFGLLGLAVVSRGQAVAVARDLSPPERESFADALGRALAEAKKGY